MTASRLLRASLFVLAFASLGAQSPSASAPIHALVAPRYSGDSAYATVAFLDQFVRWPGNRGFDASIAHIVARLEAAGYVREDRASEEEHLTYRVERYPMAQPAWEPVDATVLIEGDATPLLRFATNRNLLATNSYATPAGGVRAELVDGGKGTPAELDRAKVKGKIVFAEMNVGRLYTEAVVRRGAIGVLGYSLPAYLQAAKHRTSIQFGSIPRDTTARGWGFALSLDARDRLRAALARAAPGAASGGTAGGTTGGTTGGATGGTAPQLRVTTDVRWTPNAVEQTVVAEIRGTTHPKERFVFSAHVQEPGANDNASGVGAQVEAARVAAELVRTRRVTPLRTITFLWGLEIRSTDRYITQDAERAEGIKWGLSLDMVGEDTKKTGGTFLIEKMPDPSAIWTRGDERHTEWGGRPITKSELTPHYFNDFVLGRALEQSATNGWVVRTNPFEGGSDHTPFLKAKKPGLLFWHFTDQFYHTDGDRIDMVSAEELRNVGITALVSALTLASANGETTRSLVAEVTRAAVARLTAEARLSTAALSSGSPKATELDILETWAAWYDAALASFADLEVGGPSAATTAAMEQGRATVRAAHRTAEASLP